MMERVIGVGLVVAVLVGAAPAPAAAQGNDAFLGPGVPRVDEPKERPAEPTPRWPDGRPILGARPGEKGLWGSCCGNLAANEVNKDAPFLPWARALYADRRQQLLEPHTRCKPSGGVRQFVTPYGVELVEFRDLQQIMIFDIGGPHMSRTIYLDGRKHPEKLEPSYYGHSIGWWEGDTLVVETVGFNERSWIDRAGTPYTERLKFTERFTRLDTNTLQIQITIDDPTAYTRVWSTVPFTVEWTPDRELFEFICQQANYAHELMVGTYEKVDRSTEIVP